MDCALRWLGNNAVDLIGLLATLGLLAVTFWYAKTTKDMATSAKEAASESARATEAAERSAQAALDAARIAQSRISIEFEGRTISLVTQGEHFATVEIRSVGDPVVVQKVRVRRAFRVNDAGVLHDAPCIVDEEMTPVGEGGLPVRLHQGERVHVAHPEMQEPFEDPVRRFLLDIEYTFSESGGAGGTRQLVISEKR